MNINVTISKIPFLLLVVSLILVIILIPEVSSQQPQCSGIYPRVSAVSESIVTEGENINVEISGLTKECFSGNRTVQVFISENNYFNPTGGYEKI